MYPCYPSLDILGSEQVRTGGFPQTVDCLRTVKASLIDLFNLQSLLKWPPVPGRKKMLSDMQGCSQYGFIYLPNILSCLWDIFNSLNRKWNLMLFVLWSSCNAPFYFVHWPDFSFKHDTPGWYYGHSFQATVMLLK